MPITLTPPEQIDATARRAYDWACLAPEDKRGKFFLSSVADERLVTEMQRLVAEAMREGISEQEFIHRAIPLLAELTDPTTGRPYYDPRYWTGLTPEEAQKADRDVTRLDSVARLRLIYRTQSELAAGRRQYEEDTDPAQLADFPAWRFVRQPGAKTKRPDHEAHEGDVRLISDTDYWLARNSPDFGGFNQPHPPWGFNSWMRCTPVSRAECERLGLLAPGDPAPVVPPATRARYTLPDTLALANSAALTALPPESLTALTEDCRALGIELQPLPNSPSSTTTAPLRDPVGETPALLELATLHQLLLPLFRKLTTPAPKPAPKPDTWQTLALPSASQFPAASGKKLTKHGIDRAYRMIRNGFTLKSTATIDGMPQTITVNDRLLSHWKIKGKKVQDETYRMEVFTEALRTLKNPQEVWEQPNGARIYLRAVEIDGNKNFITGVVVDKNNTVVSFIRTKFSNYVDNKRHGKLLYKKIDTTGTRDKLSDGS